MRIHNPETGTYVSTSCTGCMCHDLPVSFGEGGTCVECGCPKTLEAWRAANACPSCGEQTVNGHCEDCQALADPAPDGTAIGEEDR